MTNQQAINLLKGLEQCLDDYCELNDEGKTAFRMAIEALEVFGNSEQLPSAQPERKTGKWIDAVLPNDNGGLPVQVCDQSNTFFPLAYTGGGHRFCPSCEAKMEVEHE